MDVRTIDHVNLRIPTNGIENAVAFYGDRLDFGIERLDAYRGGNGSFFDVRLAPVYVIRLRPTEAFESSTGTNYNYVAVVVDSDIVSIKETLAAAGAPVANESQAPLGATGRAPAVYVDDPFGYRVELKAAVEYGTEASEPPRDALLRPNASRSTSTRIESRVHRVVRLPMAE